MPAPRLASSTGLLISVYSIAAALSATLLGRASRKRRPAGASWRPASWRGAATVASHGGGLVVSRRSWSWPPCSASPRAAPDPLLHDRRAMVPAEHRRPPPSASSPEPRSSEAPRARRSPGSSPTCRPLGIYWTNAALFASLAIALLPAHAPDGPGLSDASRRCHGGDAAAEGCPPTTTRLRPACLAA